MGVAIGILLIAATIASFVAVSVRARKMSMRDDGAWILDPDSGHRVQQHDLGHHDDHHGGGSPGGGHHG